MSFLDFKTKNLAGDLASGAISALIAIPDAIASDEQLSETAETSTDDGE